MSDYKLFPLLGINEGDGITSENWGLEMGWCPIEGGSLEWGGDGVGKT